MTEIEKIRIDKKELSEIEKKITIKLKIYIDKKVEKYVDKKLEPILKNFRKKEDFFEIKFL